MDTIRHTYVTSMRFGTDLSQTSKVHWRFCQPGAEILGFPTPFVSRDHDAWETWPPLGEVQGAPRINDRPPQESFAPGTAPPCGSRKVWANGWDGTVPPLFPRNMFGLSACCGGLIDLPGHPVFGMTPQALPAFTPIPQLQLPALPPYTTEVIQQWNYATTHVLKPPAFLPRQAQLVDVHAEQLGDAEAIGQQWSVAVIPGPYPFIPRPQLVAEALPEDAGVLPGSNGQWSVAIIPAPPFVPRRQIVVDAQAVEQLQLPEKNLQWSVAVIPPRPFVPRTQLVSVATGAEQGLLAENPRQWSVATIPARPFVPPKQILGGGQEEPLPELPSAPVQWSVATLPTASHGPSTPSNFSQNGNISTSSIGIHWGLPTTAGSTLNFGLIMDGSTLDLTHLPAGCQVLSTQTVATGITVYSLCIQNAVAQSNTTFQALATCGMAAVACEQKGANAVSLDKTSPGATGSGTSASSGSSGTTSQAKENSVAIFGFAVTGGASGFTNGYTLGNQQGFSGATVCLAYLALNSTASTSTVATVFPGGSWAGTLSTFT